jgi:predicted ester cyclase
MATEAAASGTIGRVFFEEQDRLRGGPAEDLCAAGYQAVLGGAPPLDRAGHEQFARAFYAAFPDLHHSIEEVFATSDRVAVRFVIDGTHRGSFFGIPPTGRRVRVCANVLMHLDNGRVSRLFGVFDEAGLLRQLGVLPG